VSIATCTKEIVVEGPTTVAVAEPAVTHTVTVELVAPAPAPTPTLTARAVESTAASARASARRAVHPPAADVVREWRGSNYSLVATQEV